MTYSNRKYFATLAITLLCSTALWADTSLTFTGEGNKKLPQHIALGSDKLRISTGSNNEWMLYDRNQNAMFIVDDAKQEYFRIDEAQIQQLSKTLGNVNSQIDAALANLPPEQQAAARAMMQGMLAGKKSNAIIPDIEIRATGKQDKVAGVACSISETWIGSERKNEVCVADDSALQLGEDDIATLQGMSSLLQKLMDEVKKSAGDMLPSDFAGNGLTQLLANGLPVRITDFENDDSVQLESVSHERIPAAQLQVPEAYQQQQINIGQ